MYTPTTARKVDALIEKHLNCVAPHERTVQFKGGNFEIGVACDHANIVDSRSLNTLLEELQGLGVVSRKAQVMWVGIRAGHFVIWAPADDVR